MSAAPKRGLGRGLSSLLGEPKAGGGDELQQIPIGKIRPNPFQPRKNFDQAALEELQTSIAEYGVLVPIIVRSRGDGYELVAGERRWRAAAALQQAAIPAIVRASDDRDSLEVAIIENLQRENLGALEEAAGFHHLMDEYAFTQEQLAARLGKSRPAIANALRLLTLSDAIKAMLSDGRLSAGHARALLAAPEADRLSLAQRVVNEGLSVRELERLAGAIGQPHHADGTKPAKPLTPDETDFESKLRFRLGTHVALRRSGKGGKIEIKFSSEKDLIRIADVLLGETPQS
ncbi:MAG: ParB/RepB/Spo0J family partition protein [Vulcanimicrobiaceae bacterium]